MYEHEDVFEDDAKKFADEIGAIYQKTSAKVQNGVEELFIKIGKKFLNLKSGGSEKKLNDALIKNKNLEDEDKKLKNIINKNDISKMNEINTIKDEVNRYKLENEALKIENKKLKDKINQNDINKMNEIEKIQDEANKYKLENEILKKENKKLNDELFRSNKIIEGFKTQNINIDNNEINNLRKEILLLNNKLNLKENEINDLKNNINNNAIEEQKFKLKDIMVITFISQDSTVQYGIKCLPSELFAEVEEKLYKKFDELRNTNNMFTANAKQILRFKKLSENQIKDGDIIQLFKLE